MIKLLRSQVMVEPIYDSDYYNPESQLILIPQQAKERCDQGIVKYIGPDVETVKPGDHVIFSGYTGSTIGIDKEIVILMHEKYIKAILDLDNYEVPGLYFKAKLSSKRLEDTIDNVLHNIKQNVPESSCKEDILSAIAKYTNNLLIPAFYEQALPLISDAYQRFYGSRVNVKKEVNTKQMDSFDGDR